MHERTIICQKCNDYNANAKTEWIHGFKELVKVDCGHCGASYTFISTIMHTKQDEINLALREKQSYKPWVGWKPPQKEGDEWANV